ncbi:MAG: hypothetical protein VX893_16195 [Candidatus Latescibacterota bacterium]|jgi:hypothetical protein|nr:hypothetical protein [Candidatus Latescibacterota bacterium]|tara:strand:- start:356 stop:478 length:123 start_codon:yes stop_codon:yes gene_type:complete
MEEKEPLADDDCSTKFYLPRAVLYPIIALLIAGAILVFSE